MTIEKILEGICEVMEDCHAKCSCDECPIRIYCDEYEKLMLDKKN